RELRAGRPQKSDGAGLRIADIGTGCGCMAIALAKEPPAATIYATDISLPAIKVAGRNAIRHGCGDRFHLMLSNLLEGFTGDARRLPPVDLPLIPTRSAGPVAWPLSATRSLGFHEPYVGNPPYIGRREAATLMREVRDYEPEIALYGGE